MKLQTTRRYEKFTHTPQVVMDVGACGEGALDVKVEGEVLRVRGRTGDLSFEREFTLPDLGAPEGVTAALSEDGVLTVTAPKTA